MDELTARVMPHSLEAEQSVLGSMLIDNRCVPDVIGILKPADFYLKQNQDIYETIYTMFNFSEPIDPVTVLNKMQEHGLANEKTSDYLMQLMEVTPTTAYVKQYATIVREKGMMRALVEASDSISNTVYEGVGTADEILEAAEKMIMSIRKGATGESLQKIGTVLVDVYNRLTELAQSDLSGMVTNMDTLVANVDGLVGTSQAGVEETMKKINAIDFDALNQAIKDLSDVIEPIAKFFNTFKLG